MSKSLKILEYLLLITAGLAALFFVGFYGFLMLMTINDQASYSGDTVDVGPIDYNSVITTAEKAGYDLSGPYTRLDKANLIEPGNIESLEKRFKTGYKISRIALYYNLNTYLEFRKDEKNQTLVTLYNYSHHDSAGDITPQMPSMFPEDPWMLKMLGMSLGLNEIDSGEFLKKLKNEASNKKGFVSLTTKENVDFPAVYAYLNQSKTTTFIGTEDKFYRNDTKLGCVGFVIPETTITRKYNSNKYNIYVNSTGLIRIDIMMPTGSAGKEIPEEEYRTVFREMFENVGLPVEKLDEIELNYTPSIW
ncbi:hypothetical protein [Methanosarcina sp.]|uniref:hypothetical protein n=1 Tax=Methanosarcina sp. TaxID=2213 RepID=UPI00298970E6|nr:hypothetical protein [Methanosarcina sp.]MDW5550228.1 hypothetical protein [Methanosarcina sp.]MDW5555470.1 hypothetical protein [Methanosarcina sp.]MDW5561547.1 hypothetical protein [Methanosarcina sp.]